MPLIEDRSRPSSMAVLGHHRLHRLGPRREALSPCGQGDRRTPDEARRFLHLLAVKRPTGANAAATIRTAVVAILVASVGRTVPELHSLRAADVLTRWLDTRAHITRQLQGNDPGHLWIPTGANAAATAPLQSNPRWTARRPHPPRRPPHPVFELLGRPVRPGTLLPLQLSTRRITHPMAHAVVSVR
ncbi:hypothetical protein [Streptomyces sp. NBC_01363]|uniref:hypothetical protein n=1 Tax=Streptomyces sp. NBC_01363 TaxID=2903840 RepID=UPI002255B09D|nr:hypothetical protein [Streptomyces sp. NBC_01363]MCX4736790.1 hypothetical protein [Streptomyces sp. NBC_01363]